MNLSTKVMAGAAVLLMSVCVMPKPAPTPTHVSAEIGCVSTNGGESCDTVTPSVSYPECWSEGQDKGPCYWDARKDGNGKGISYFLNADGSVQLLSFS